LIYEYIFIIMDCVDMERKIAALGPLANIVLAAGKVVAGLLSGSSSILAACSSAKCPKYGRPLKRRT